MRHAEAEGIPRDTPWNKLSPEQKEWVLKGSPKWKGQWNKQWFGVDRFFEYLETKAYKMLVMIAEFRDGPPEAKFSLRHAYTSARVYRDTMQSWRSVHKLFDNIMTSIQEEMVDTMRAEAYRRAVIGHEEPVFYQGVRTDTVRKFSDGLLQFTLMGYDAKFRAKDVNMNVSGQLDSNINIEGLRDRLAQRLQQKSKAEE
jgi:hypothetical protein